ncbi:alpha/beta hydrolase-fold protein [Nocardioides zeae]|uniref:Alpha/beta hydrolase-fold protein n=1 Tax=Nocardioides imazamoxiresistens TaxID=3231893 RepID=A0ABU3PV13_9ACTN|nr:alpha/beta hydrolase-fold protein [Nocardioides zeae]MDT9593060.1 alpha/beta hydrolase-fold protein [Nocardioides zeae]
MDQEMARRWLAAHGVGDPPPSPTIEALRAVADDPAAVEAFWARTTRTPLVERDPTSATHRLLTFVWRQQAPDAHGVEVVPLPRHVHATALTSGLMADHTGASMPLRRIGASDVWAATLRVRADLRTVYQLRELTGDPAAPRASIGTFDAHVDPLNPDRFPPPARVPVGDAAYTVPESVVELPDAPRRASLRGGPLSGRTHEESFTSVLFPSTRRVWVHVPEGYAADGPPLGVLVLHDGQHWMAHTDVAGTLDRRVAAGAAPLVLVAVESRRDLPGDLGCGEEFTRSVVEELLPGVRARWNVIDDPARTIVAGQSWGALNALFTGLRHPDVVGNVIAQSGSFWWGPDFGTGPEFHGGHGALMHEIATRPRLPLRVHLEVGLLEGDQVPVNRHLRDVLLAKGYDTGYAEFHGQHSWLCWQHGIVDALDSVTRDW